jgi:hypothetical protein
VAQSNAKLPIALEESLAQLKLAATIAEEASRWLRNCLVRLRAGHEVDFEIQSAERALQVAIAQVSGTPRREPCESEDEAVRVRAAPTAGAGG